jgi:SAM-dependent methyltransferase
VLSTDRRWSVERFLATGEPEVEAVLAACAELGRPAARTRVLDFGCGVGRLARPFADRFDEYLGTDIAEGMIAWARELHADLPNATFKVNTAAGLAGGDGSFDLVYSNLVLQHLPDRAAVESSLAELLRVVNAEGILVFQLPARLGLRQRLQLRSRLYRGLRNAGAGAAFLQRRLRLNPMRLLAIPEPQARELVERHGGRVAAVMSEEASGISSRRYCVTPAPWKQSPRYSGGVTAAQDARRPPS